MSVSKTRQKLVDVARQLFAKNGIANTTMNDIAVAYGMSESKVASLLFRMRNDLKTYFEKEGINL